MDRIGMQSLGFVMLLSFSLLMLLNQQQQRAALEDRSALVVASTEGSSSFGMEDLQRTLAAGGEMRRQLLQVATPAPAPGPASSSSGQTYISYGALTADYVPCPPQTGRSYYTPDCQSASGPVNPYTRGCSVITLCARS